MRYGHRRCGRRGGGWGGRGLVHAPHVPGAGRELRDEQRRLRRHDRLRFVPDEPVLRRRRVCAVWNRRNAGWRRGLHPQGVCGSQLQLRCGRGRLWRSAAMRNVHAASVLWRRRVQYVRGNAASDASRRGGGHRVHAGDVHVARLQLRPRRRRLRRNAPVRHLFGHRHLRRRQQARRLRKCNALHEPLHESGQL